MVAFVKPDNLNNVWASGGDRIYPGDTKYATGWQVEIPPRQYFNEIDYKQDQFIAHINQRGMAEWDSTTEYQSGKSYTQGSDGVVYKSVQTSTNQNPVLDSAEDYWTVAFADAGDFYTQAESDARYLIKSLNGSDINNVATFRANLSVYSKAESDAAFQQSSPLGSYSNLKTSSTGLNALLSITCDQITVQDSTANTARLLKNVSLNCSVATTGVNGLDTGTSATNTWYSVWIIYNGTVTASLFSLSATTPTLPAGYTFKARIGWVRTDSSANKFLLPIRQVGSLVEWRPAPGRNMTSSPAMTSTASSITAVTFNWTAFAPPTCGAIRVTQSSFPTTGRAYCYVYNGDTTAVNSISASNVANDQALMPSELIVEGNTLTWTALISATGTCSILSLGWLDNF